MRIMPEKYVNLMTVIAIALNCNALNNMGIFYFLTRLLVLEGSVAVSTPHFAEAIRYRTLLAR